MRQATAHHSNATTLREPKADKSQPSDRCAKTVCNRKSGIASRVRSGILFSSNGVKGMGSELPHERTASANLGTSTSTRTGAPSVARQLQAGVVEHPACKSDRRVLDAVQRLRLVLHLNGVSQAVLIEEIQRRRVHDFDARVIGGHIRAIGYSALGPKSNRVWLNSGL